MASSLLALLDDISTILDDVATLTKIATRKTAGVLGDDLEAHQPSVDDEAEPHAVPFADVEVRERAGRDRGAVRLLGQGREVDVVVEDDGVGVDALDVGDPDDTRGERGLHQFDDPAGGGVDGVGHRDRHGADGAADPPEARADVVEDGGEAGGDVAVLPGGRVGGLLEGPAGEVADGEVQLAECDARHDISVARGADRQGGR